MIYIKFFAYTISYTGAGMIGADPACQKVTQWSGKILKESWKVSAGIVLASAISWVVSLMAHNRFLSFVSHAPGIDLVFLPSGVRLIALMIGGFWAALGICLGALVLTGSELNTAQVGVILTVAACAGICPYVALRLSMRMAGVESGLGNLRAVHLPVIALGVALGSSLVHNIVFSLSGLSPWTLFGEHVLAMAAGDFLGILLAVMIVFVILRVVRKVTGPV